MKSPNKNKNNTLNAYLSKIIGLLEDTGEDIGFVATNKFNMPVVDEEGNEDWICVTVAVGRESYDGYGARESYVLEKKLKAKLAAEKAKKEAQYTKPAKSSKNEEEE